MTRSLFNLSRQNHGVPSWLFSLRFFFSVFSFDHSFMRGLSIAAYFLYHYHNIRQFKELSSNSTLYFFHLFLCVLVNTRLKDPKQDQTASFKNISNVVFSVFLMTHTFIIQVCMYVFTILFFDFTNTCIFLNLKTSKICLIN